MQAIHWLKWMDNPFQLHKPETVSARGLIWEDSITDTLFYISEDDYNDHYNLLKGALSGCSADECFKIWNAGHQQDIFFGPSEKIARAIHLPYPRPHSIEEGEVASSQGKLIRTRLVDYILLRTGLSYTLLSSEERKNWSSIRQTLLQLNSDETSPIDAYLRTGKWSGEEIHVDLVKAGAVKIKQYFLETSNIQEIRGASTLLDEINGPRLLNLVSEHWTPECLIYSGGGNMLLILPEGEGAACAQQIEEAFTRITVSAQSVAATATVPFSSLTRESFGSTLGWLEMKKTQRQMTRTIPDADRLREEDVMINLYRTVEIPENVKLLSYEQTAAGLAKDAKISGLLTKHGLLCLLCKRREAKKAVEYKNKETPVCLSCLHKIRAGRNSQESTRTGNRLYQKFNRPARMKEKAENLSDLVQNAKDEITDYIAIIYGDGNNMGQVVSRIQSFTQYRYFSYLTDSITKASAYLAIEECMGSEIADANGKARFEMIAVGGDDVFFIVPGRYSVDVARVLGQKFDDAYTRYGSWQDQKKKRIPEEGITISTGVCIGDYNMPVTVLFNTAQELLKQAKTYKKKIKTEEPNACHGGTIDVMKLKSSTPYAGGLKEYRSSYFTKRVSHAGKTEVPLSYLLRPYTKDQLDRLNRCVLTLKKEVPTGRTLLYRMREAVLDMGIQEAKLFYLYVIDSGRGSKDQQKQRKDFHNIVTACMEGYEPELPYFYNKKHNELYAPWHDLIELWDVIEEETR